MALKLGDTVRTSASEHSAWQTEAGTVAHVDDYRVGVRWPNHNRIGLRYLTLSEAEDVWVRA